MLTMNKAKERCGTYRYGQGIINVGNNSPIKGKGTESHSSACSKQHIDNSVLGSNPANPVEHAQSCEEVTRDPVPDKTSSCDNPKYMFFGNLAWVMVAVIFVEGIEESTVSQRTWPDHTRWPDNKLTKKATQREAKKLGPKAKQDLEDHGGCLAIENMLCECDIV